MITFSGDKLILGLSKNLQGEERWDRMVYRAIYIYIYSYGARGSQGMEVLCKIGKEES